ncbi:hypothetical protein GCM10023321_22870 [Pseudonocardia eucalypti]|uniref:HTH tetR-type domain-containing protein n=1 Tax=Pseudonocardia eucalypti TaxID=648755 RepID=A0ABP9PX75_9PSEU|nr:AcrR family transcriptional regulator [Pseudonocardia eucalypti]
MTRPAALPAERLRPLLDTAAREFAEFGYAAASLNRVIGACGMSKSSFYYYFASKEALFEAVVADLGGALVDRAGVPEPEGLAGAAFWPEVEQLFGRLLGLAERDPRFADIGRIFYLPDLPTSDDSPVRRAVARINRWLEALLAAGRSCGEVRTDLPASLQAEITLGALWAMDKWAVRHLDELPPESLAELAEAQFKTLRRILAT